MQRVCYFLLIATCFSCIRNKKVEKPNVVLIMADDLGWSDLGCYGGEIETPNLDKLAFEGIRYTQFYNTAKCFPSRASLLTGLYAQQVGVGSTWQKNWQNHLTVAERLKKRGYVTLWSGKHHGVDNPHDLGFDKFYGLFGGACNHFNPGKQRAGEPRPAQKRERKWIIDEQIYQPYTPDSKLFYTTDAFTDTALGWLDEYAEQSFFLYLAYTAPHDPLMAWQEDIDKYRDIYKVGYEAIRTQRFQKQKELGLISNDLNPSEPAFTPWDSLDEATKNEEALKMAVYAAMIDRMDQNIGKVVEKLEEKGILENTIILFLSDNGSSAEVVEIEGQGEIGTMGQWTYLGKNWANVSNTPFKYYKNYSYEGGINTPLIVHWPDQIKEKGHIEKYEYGHLIDLLPSILQTAGTNEVEESGRRLVLPLEGRPLKFTREDQSFKSDPLYWEWQDGRAMRDGKWKIVSEGNSGWELYDLAKDPAETNNVANGYQEIVQEMNSQFLVWRDRVNKEVAE